MTDQFKWQRWVFKKARENGWPGREPDVLGTHASEEAFFSAKHFLLSKGVKYGMANIWFAGTCADCKVWSPTWDEYSTTQMKCPACGALQSVNKLTLHEQRKKAVQQPLG